MTGSHPTPQTIRTHAANKTDKSRANRPNQDARHRAAPGFKVLLGYDSALQHWRYAGSSRLDDGASRSAATQEALYLLAKAPAPVIDDASWRIGIDFPLHILVGKKSRTERLAIPHVYTDAPDGSFLDAGNGYLVSSPEFTFLQMATKLPLAQLVLLGYELCGYYALVNDADNGMIPRKHPLTSVAAMKAFLQAAPNRKGRKRADHALRYVVDGSYSVMESALVLLLTLPYSMGGYGLPQPCMNYELRLSQNQSVAAHRKACICDLYWPDFKLDVEYDSYAHHSDSSKIARDAERRNALADMGIDVITVTTRQLFSEREFDGVAHQIARKLGKRLRYDASTFAATHSLLRRELFEALGMGDDCL